MRYMERIKYSWGYHWGLFCEVWDMLTLHNWHWIVVGLLVVLYVVPAIVSPFSSGIGYFVNTPFPLFDPSISQDIAYERAWTAYYSRVPKPPLLLAVITYHWVASSGYKPLANVLGIISAGLLMAVWFRKEKGAY